jgi:hypothetical protein
MILTLEDAACMTAKRVAAYPVGTVIIVTQCDRTSVYTAVLARKRRGWTRQVVEVDGIPGVTDIWASTQICGSAGLVMREIRSKHTVSVQVFTPDLTES